MKNYKILTTDELKSLWSSTRDKIAEKGVGNCTREEMDELASMKKEIDRREGKPLPGKNINFADYLTD